MFAEKFHILSYFESKSQFTCMYQVQLFYMYMCVYLVLQCAAGPSVRGYIDQIFMEPTKIMIVGADCSTSTEPVAELAPFWNLVQVRLCREASMYIVDFIIIAKNLRNSYEYTRSQRAVIYEDCDRKTELNILKIISKVNQHFFFFLKINLQVLVKKKKFCGARENEINGKLGGNVIDVMCCLN